VIGRLQMSGCEFSCDVDVKLLVLVGAYKYKVSPEQQASVSHPLSYKVAVFYTKSVLAVAQASLPFRPPLV
jgi:hypothetical protein